MGSNGNDNFIFNAGGSLSGAVDGRAGQDTLTFENPDGTIQFLKTGLGSIDGEKGEALPLLAQGFDNIDGFTRAEPVIFTVEEPKELSSEIAAAVGSVPETGSDDDPFGKAIAAATAAAAAAGQAAVVASVGGAVGAAANFGRIVNFATRCGKTISQLTSTVAHAASNVGKVVGTGGRVASTVGSIASRNEQTSRMGRIFSRMGEMATTVAHVANVVGDGDVETAVDDVANAVEAKDGEEEEEEDNEVASDSKDDSSSSKT